ncbi:MAG: hypothetical protein LUG93_05805 [Lachnospiraceae bacterium]|nr:hypothetical protein [Lachnospiraceae bacterium]
MADWNERTAPAGQTAPAWQEAGSGSAGAPQGRTDADEVTIKFGKGLVGEPFTSRKTGKQLVEVSIPNADPSDKRPWARFVVPPGMIHDNKFGKGVWMKLPRNGTTRVSRPVLQGQDENGRNIWKREIRDVPNTDLKEMVEFYRDKSRGSVLSDLEGKRAAAAEAPRKAPRQATRPKDPAR